MTPNGESGYRADIDGLRAIAVTAVVAFHAFPTWLPGGFVGVDIFFVISGYLISGIILRALAEGRFSFADFYARRVRRIFPALIVILAAAFVVGWFTLSAGPYKSLGRQLVAATVFLSNYLLWRDTSYFNSDAELNPLLHLWSLAIEEQFYLVWPMLLLFAFRWRRGPLVMTLAIGALSFVTSILTVRLDPTTAFYAPWTRFWELLAGAALASVAADAVLSRWLATVLAARWSANLMAVTGSGLILVAVVVINPARVFPGLWALMPVVGAMLLLLAGRETLINRLVLSHPVMVGLGLISYPLYLWHWPVLSFMRITTAGSLSLTRRLLVVAASFVLAYLTYRLIERPARFGSRRRFVVPIALATMVVIATAGLGAEVTEGFSRRAYNRSDAARFVEYYQHMRRTGIADAYRAECDFMNWNTGRTELALDPSCTSAGRDRTFLLWGDSFAQALSLGIRQQLTSNTALAQVATSGCRPALEPYEIQVPDRRCERGNELAMASISKLRPSLVILAQKSDHAATDWVEVARRIVELGAGSVILVGPAPQWSPSLPAVFAANFLSAPQPYVALGLDEARLSVDRELSATLNGKPHITYVSLMGGLCRADGCLAQVPGKGPLDLMTLDAGHLTPEGSSYIGREILRPYLLRVP